MNVRRSPSLTRAGLLVVTALAGCTTVGPDYHVAADAAIHRPGASAPFESGRDSAALQSAPLPMHWWRLYQDPMLDGLVQQALVANTDLRVAQANLARAQAQRDATRATARPTIDVNAKPAYGHVSGVQALSPETRPQNQYTYSSGVNVAYTVDLFGQIRRAEEAAQGDADAAQAAVDATRVTVAAETARAYADACSSGMQLAQAQRSVDIQGQSLSVTRRLAQAGRGTALDITRAQAQWDQLNAALPPYRAQRQAALYRLATLTGELPTAFPKALATCSTPPTLTQPVPTGDGAALLARRPDIRQAERDTAAATARIGVATADLYPSISLGLSGASGGPMSRVGERGTFSWSLGPLISWTLPNTGAAQARIAEAEADTQAAAARFDATILTALRETETALNHYARQLDRDDALHAARDDAALAAEQAQRLFVNGKTDYLTVLDAQRTLAQTESLWADSRAALVDQQIAIFMALGGGWEP